MTGQHSTQGPGTGVHVPYNWTYADSTARLAATGFVAGDVGKLALQSSDNSLWMLTATTPTWQAQSASPITINVLIDGGGSVITTGVKSDFTLDFDGTIQQATLLADQSGSIVVDI